MRTGRRTRRCVGHLGSPARRALPVRRGLRRAATAPLEIDHRHEVGFAHLVDAERQRFRRGVAMRIGRCVGLRLAELQLKIIWEEIFKRFDRIEVMGEPKRPYSSFIKGYEWLPVSIPA